MAVGFQNAVGCFALQLGFRKSLNLQKRAGSPALSVFYIKAFTKHFIIMRSLL